MSISDTWDTSTFEASPAGTEQLSLGDDKIRAFKRAVRQRGEREHLWAVTDTNSKHGWHREGSARVFVGTAPSAYSDPDATAIGGDATLDQGRMNFDSAANYLPRVYDSGWKSFIREIARISIQGNLATGTSVVPPIVFGEAVTLVKAVARVLTAPTTNSLLLDINNQDGTVFAAGTSRIAIQPGEYAASSADFSVASLTAADYLLLDIDQVGGETDGADLSVTIEVVL